MANNYYNFGGPFIPNTKVRSGQVNPEFAGVESGFDLLPSASDALTRGVAELGIDVQGGTVNEFDVAMPDTRLSNQEGDLVVFRATHTNDGPIVINVDTIGDIAAVEFDGSAFAGGELVTGRVYEFRYDNANTQFVLSQSTDAANQAISAEDWAIRPEDDPVPVSSGGDGATTFSALHWSAKSAAFGGGLDFAGDHNAGSGDPASPATGNPLYRIITSGGVITGAGQVEIGDDIYWNGTDWNRINNQPGSFVQGTSVDDPTAPGSFDSNFQWQNANGAPLANVGFNAGQSFDINNVVHGGGLRLRGENGAGSLETYLQGSAGSGTLLMFAGVQKFATAVAGAIINDSTTNDPTAGLGQSALINLRNGSFATVADFGFTGASTTLRVKSAVHGGPLELVGETTAGVERVLFFHDPDTVGPVFEGILDNDPALNFQNQDARITFRNPSADDIWAMGFLDGDDDLIIQSFNEGGHFVARGEPAGGAVRVLWDIDPNSDFELYANDNVALTLFGSQSRSNSDSTSNVWSFITNNNTDFVGLVEADPGEFLIAGDDVSIRVAIYATDFTVDQPLMATFDADTGLSQLYFASAGGASKVSIRTQDEGIEVVGDSTTNVELEMFALDGTTSLAMLRHVAGSVRLEPQVNNEGVSIFSRSVGGVLQQSFQAVNNGTAQIYHQGNIRALTSATGFAVHGSAVNAVNLTLEDSAGTDMLTVIGTAGFMTFNSPIDSAEIRFTGNNSVSASNILMNLDPDGSADLYHLGLLRAYTGLEAWLLHSEVTDAPSAGLSQEGSFILENVNSLEAARFGFIGTTTVLRMRSSVVSGIIQIEGLDSGSGQATMLQGSPDGATALFHAVDNVSAARTLAIASGGFEVNNTLTGAGFERVLTIADRTSAAVYTPTNVVTTRTYDANATSIDELADVLGTLIADLQAIDVIQ